MSDDIRGKITDVTWACLRSTSADVPRQSRYRPAHIGGCRTSTKVQMPLNFFVSRSP